MEDISQSEAQNEYVMLGMRLTEGVCLADFKKKFGKELLSAFPSFKKYAPEFVKIDGERCAFTEKGMMVSNFILSDALIFGEE